MWSFYFYNPLIIVLHEFTIRITDKKLLIHQDLEKSLLQGARQQITIFPISFGLDFNIIHGAI